MLDLDLIFSDTAPVRQIQQVIDTKEKFTGKIVPVKAQDILNYEMWTSICREGKTAVRSTTCTIPKLLHLISEGYTIIPCKTSPKFCQQILLLHYDYSYGNCIKPTDFNKNILPTFIVNYEKTHYYSVSSPEKTAILGYCFNEPIRSKTLMQAISSNLQKTIYRYNYEINKYCSNDFSTKATNVSISNNIYVPVEGGISRV